VLKAKLSEEKKGEVQKFLNTVVCEVDQSFVEVHPKRWRFIWKHAKRGVVYVAAPRSRSADLYVFWDEVILAVQVKSGGTAVTLADIVKEAKKTFTFHIPTILVIAVTALCADVGLLKGKKITTTEYHVSIRSGGCVCFGKQNYCVPDNAELIVLLPKGLDMFLSAPNVLILK